jgi:tetratricopeptide (TPR) repeat protein
MSLLPSHRNAATLYQLVAGSNRKFGLSLAGPSSTLPMPKQGGPRLSKRTVQLERAIEAALRPGRFISYNAVWDFVRGTEEVATKVRALIDEGHAGEAVTLFETFIAACYEKAGEVDDSSGSFGRFVDELFCDWVRARQSAGAKPEETVALLLAWMEEDDAGFCYELERDLVKALNEDGLRAFAAQVRVKLEASAPDDRGFVGAPRRRWAAALKRILAAQGDAEAYVVLAEEKGLDSMDCSVVAGIHVERGALDEALAWVERGLALVESEGSDSAEAELKERQRALLPRLGRADEAIAAVWADFERRPGKYSYEDLMALVPEDERPGWRDKAMAAAERGGLSPVIELFVETREVERLAGRLETVTDDELEGLSHHTTEPAAGLLAEAYPALAAKVYRALGLRVVNAKKSKYYDEALRSFERARDCYVAAGQRAIWEALVEDVRRAHRRKHGFMPGFERLVEGGPAIEPQPRFLDRARSRWPRGGRS